MCAEEEKNKYRESFSEKIHKFKARARDQVHFEEGKREFLWFKVLKTSNRAKNLTKFYQSFFHIFTPSMDLFHDKVD